MGNVEKNKRYAHLDQLSTQKLEDILRADLELQESGNSDMVLYIMEVIEKRENGKSLENRADAERALKEFHELYNTSDSVGQSLYPANTVGDTPLQHSEMPTPQTKNRHFLRRLFISTAAAAIITIFLVPSALGYETFYEMVGSWTESTFQFVKKDNADNIDVVWQEKLNTYGILASVLPTKIPQDFVLQEWDIVEQEVSGDIEFVSFYLRDKTSLMISATCYNQSKSAAIEKDTTEVEEYRVGGITYYLFENLSQRVATWHVDNIECIISGDISIDEIKMMIDSIEVRS